MISSNFLTKTHSTGGRRGVLDLEERGRGREEVGEREGGDEMAWAAGHRWPRPTAAEARRSERRRARSTSALWRRRRKASEGGEASRRESSGSIREQSGMGLGFCMWEALASGFIPGGPAQPPSPSGLAQWLVGRPNG